MSEHTEELLAEIAQEKERIRARDRLTQERYRKNSADKAKANQQRYREKHKDKIRAYNKAYIERIGVAAATQRTIASQHKRRVRLGGPPPEQCTACGDTSKLVFDHCHSTDKFRGWLCHGCNKALGFVKDDSQRLRRLADYIDVFNSQ